MPTQAIAASRNATPVIVNAAPKPRSAAIDPTTNGAAALAFPSISTGIYGYPIEPAARIAAANVRASLLAHASIEAVVFCCFSAADLAVYDGILKETAC